MSLQMETSARAALAGPKDVATGLGDAAFRLGRAHRCEIDLLTTPGLGDNTYLVRTGRDAVIVDPQRDAWRYLRTLQELEIKVRHVLETHVHNDYISGGLEIRAATGAKIIGPSLGRFAFPHRGVVEGDVVDLDGYRLVALETPGHTPEHISYALFEGGVPDPIAIFSGGSLMVGSAGRTDLVDGLTNQLTRAQFHSVQRLASFPGDVLVLPTHGAGSFCAAAGQSRATTSTIAEERRTNTALLYPDEEGFVRGHLSGLLAYPTYYRHMAPMNRAGPRVVGGLPRPARLTPKEVARRQGFGAWVVDGRDREAFAAAHLPGSINVELDDSFATYVGWMVPFGAPLVLILPDDGAAEIAVTQLLRIGYDRVEGYATGDMPAWQASGMLLRSYPVVSVDDLVLARRSPQAPLVLDVRQPREWETGMIPGSQTIFVCDLRSRLGEIPHNREVWTICATGRRAAIAASLLDAAGINVRLVAREGVGESLKRFEERRSAPWPAA